MSTIPGNLESAIRKEAGGRADWLLTVLREIVALGDCGFDPPNQTRLLAVKRTLGSIGRSNQFFAVTSAAHHAANSKVQKGCIKVFVQMCGRAATTPPGPGWTTSSILNKNKNGEVPKIWWEYEPLGSPKEIPRVVDIARTAYASWESND